MLHMKKKLVLLCLLCLQGVVAFSQCAICTKTAANLDDESARGLNGGILYLAAMPLLIIGFFTYKWYQQSKVKEFGAH